MSFERKDNWVSYVSVGRWRDVITCGVSKRYRRWCLWLSVGHFHPSILAFQCKTWQKKPLHPSNPEQVTTCWTDPAPPRKRKKKNKTEGFLYSFCECTSGIRLQIFHFSTKMCSLSLLSSPIVSKSHCQHPTRKTLWNCLFPQHPHLISKALH